MAPVHSQVGLDLTASKYVEIPGGVKEQGS